ncbi:hypothetical protein [Kitasatospora sp. NPDC088783]|uniref:hypothetical protein n=1 Tax=Kitasatospora sp. NPDC088783 TaxID=3364077 RepID=UPI00380C84AD
MSDDIPATAAEGAPAGAHRRGPRDVSAAALAAAPTEHRLTIPQIAQLLGLTRKSVNHWSTSSAYGEFPPPDVNGAREWGAVRSFVLRQRDPRPADGAGTEEWRKWVMRHADDRGPGAELLDEHGLTMNLRDVVERSRIAGSRAGLDMSDLAPLLARTARPGMPERLRLPTLAKVVEIDRNRLHRLVQAHAGDAEDPFPAPDDRGYPVGAVRDWLARRSLI